MANVERLIELRRVVELSDDYDHHDSSKCVAGHACLRTSFKDDKWFEAGGYMPAAKKLLDLTDAEASDLFAFSVQQAVRPFGSNAKTISLAQLDILIEHHSEQQGLPVPALKDTYDQLSALCAQMAAALDYGENTIRSVLIYIPARDPRHDVCVARADAMKRAITAYAALSPDPQWQRVPEGCVVVPAEPTLDIATRIMAGANVGAEQAKRIYTAVISVAPSNRARGEG